MSDHIKANSFVSKVAEQKDVGLARNQALEALENKELITPEKEDFLAKVKMI